MPITLYEPFRAVFYTGFYASFAIGAYADQGLDVRLGNPNGKDASTELLAGKADVIWSGPMRLMQHHDRDPGSALLGFAEVVTRDPFFLVGGRPNPGFRLEELRRLRLGTVSEVPTPWLCLQEDIRRVGLDPAGLDRVTDRSMAENADALRAGTLDVIQVFEPFVEQLLQDGAGHIWYAAANRGPTTYTTLITTRDLAKRDPGTLLAMTRAVQRTQDWLHATAAPEIAAAVASYFPELAPAVLEGAIARYKGLGLWGRDPLLPVTGFARLKLGLLSGGFIARDVAYDACVEPRFAREVIGESR